MLVGECAVSICRLDEIGINRQAERQSSKHAVPAIHFQDAAELFYRTWRLARFEYLTSF